MITIYLQLSILLAGALASLVLSATAAVLVLLALQLVLLLWTVWRTNNSTSAPTDTNAGMLEYSQRLIDAIPFPIYIKDQHGTVLLINQAQVAQWQHEKKDIDLVGKQSYHMNSSIPHQQTSMREDADIIANNANVAKEELYTNLHTSEMEYRHISKRKFVDTDGRPLIACVKFDLSPQRRAEQRLLQEIEHEKTLRERSTEFIQRVIDVIPDPFYIKNDAGFFVMVNEAYARHQGFAKHELIGKPVTKTKPRSAELAKDTPFEDKAVLDGAEINKDQHYISPITGEEKYRHISKRLCLGMDGEKLIVVAHFDITPWKMAEREIERLASTDALTQLHNRRSFDTHAQHLISLAKRHNQALSLLILDVDHFKNVNDRYGHLGGDAVLQHIGELLHHSLRDEDVACRWGGEEFAVLLPMVDSHGALELANRLRLLVQDLQIAFQGQAIRCTISGGVAQCLPHEELTQCLARADMALYVSKTQGRNRMTMAPGTTPPLSNTTKAISPATSASAPTPAD
ncbi:sensor domain-containing diguanylate cyclase [Curvibacter sp. CHRR-16]|uniref:sensor domain-containing diguanylate cyclase n=1 Tax=Curvibacter sp. CHRR-16 TaxID=2835872 RepID=UPI001BDA58EA|nr:sensor domain-containing diguanylate cyclase [Curvibacter sp. CHRR-16]MBT0569177.1 sensor domain-containing diguanylate cyclase [Curvibacter sp. CHRR-16]